MEHSTRWFVLALSLSILLLALAPLAAATHEEQPPPPWQVVCPSPGSSADCAWSAWTAWWQWLTHEAFPVSDPCLPNEQPACM